MNISKKAKEAQEHCQLESMRKAGKWFDGYRKINKLQNIIDVL